MDAPCSSGNQKGINNNNNFRSELMKSVNYSAGNNNCIRSESFMV
jgi:hypothetical protein